MKKCPICRVDLTHVEYEGSRILRCDQCRGHLVSELRLRMITRVNKKPQNELKSEVTTEFDASTLTPVKCPQCHITMRKRLIKLPMLKLHSDVCKHCELVWLDGGELALAQLGYEASVGFIDGQEMKRRAEALRSSPERKAEFEANMRELRKGTPMSEAMHELGDSLLGAILSDRSIWD